MRLSVSLGLGSEAGLRSWNFVASVLMIPAMYFLGCRLGLKRPALIALLALVATSPVIDRYGCQARGYGLAILLTAVSLTLHFECCTRPSRAKIAVLGTVNVLLVLANLFTLPLICGEILHLVIESLHSGSTLRQRGHLLYDSHLFGLILSIRRGLLLHAFLLPSIFLNSIVFSSKGVPTIPLVLRLFSAPLVPSGSVVFGGVLLLVLFTYGISREKDERERSSSLAMHVVLGTCTLSAVVLHIFEFRAFAYLHAPTMALLVLGLWHLDNSKRLSVPMIPALVIACTIGVYASVNRPPIQDYRGLIRKAKDRAAGCLLWTSGFGADGIEHYAAVPIPEEFPLGPSFYLSLFGSDKNDPLLATVKRRCKLVEQVRSEEPMAIYECIGK